MILTIENRWNAGFGLDSLPYADAVKNILLPLPV
jgi:hypothetical protein